MAKIDVICSDAADILGGNYEVKDGICHITITRTDIDLTILDVPSTAPLAHMFAIEPISGSNRTLNTGEMVLLQEEVPYVARALLDRGIIVSGIHNHWLYDSPHLIYIHIEAVMRPLVFAQRVADSLAASREETFTTD